MDFEKLFIASKGQHILYQQKKVKWEEEILLPRAYADLRVTFLAKKSRWPQAAMLHTDGIFEFKKYEIQIPNSVLLWQLTWTPYVDIRVTSKNGRLVVHNAWAARRKWFEAKTGGAALYTEKLAKGICFYCNDGDDDDDFDDLVFKVEFLEA